MKGQVSLFIIVGIVLFMSVGAFVFLIKATSTPEFIEADASPIKQFLKQCLDRHVGEAIVEASSNSGYILASKGGGRADPPPGDFTFQGKFYVVQEGPPLKPTPPNVELVSGELETFVANNIVKYTVAEKPYCNLRTTFKDYTFADLHKPEAQVILNEDQYYVVIHSSIEAESTFGGQKYHFDEISSSHFSLLKQAVDVTAKNAENLFLANTLIPSYNGFSSVASSKLGNKAVVTSTKDDFKYEYAVRGLS